jgi:hypothetical protein
MAPENRQRGIADILPHNGLIGGRVPARALGDGFRFNVAAPVEDLNCNYTTYVT